MNRSSSTKTPANELTKRLKLTLANLTLCAGIVALSSTPIAAQQAVDIPASMDNTLYESVSGGKSNGSGQYLFAGRTSSSAELRRGLLKFDLSTPFPNGAGIKVDSAIVILHMSKSVAGAMPVALHKVTAEWGESTSDAPGEEGSGTDAASGDATWTHRIHATATWQSLGGDFDSESVASQTVSGVGFYRWKSQALTSLVQAWLIDPVSNAGMAIIGNEQALSRSTKRFDSRENQVVQHRPVLRIYYTVHVSTERNTELPRSLTSLEVFPNPSGHMSQLNMHFENSRVGRVQISAFDLLGRKVFSATKHTIAIGRQQLKLSLPNLRPGPYVVRVSNGESVASTLILVQ